MVFVENTPLVISEEQSILKDAVCSSVGVDPRRSSGGPNGIIDGNFASIMHSDGNHGDLVEFAIDLA